MQFALIFAAVCATTSFAAGVQVKEVKDAKVKALKDSDFEAPWYYHGLNGPEFTVEDVDVEARSYPAALWASTDVLSTNINDAGSIGFNRLFDYISGANEGSVVIDMTTPVLTKVLPGQGPNCNSTFVVSFYVPYLYQTAAGPPKPTSADVYIQTIGPKYVAVSEFDGFAVQDKAVAETVSLSKEVGNSEDVKQDTADPDTWYLVGYDPPFRITNRHNEVWLDVVEK